MIRERILRLHRHKSSLSSPSSSGHKLDFTFSNVQALQVPKGWDKITLSLISSESGKTVRKSGKAAVKNGTCKWTETFPESIWISDKDSSKETMEEYFFKFLVSAGSSRSGILGETSLNLSAFLSSESPILVSLPLKKCNYGTILQVEVRCLTPKINLRDEKWKEMHASKHEHSDQDDMDNRSEIFDNTTTKSTDSFSSNNLASISRPRELGSRETCLSASFSHYSLDSMDDYVGRQSFSSQSDKNLGMNNCISRQDSIESNDSASYCSYSTRGSVKSIHSQEVRKLTYATTTSSHPNAYSSKTLKETDDDATKVHELDAEASMWEENARKLAVELESLRKDSTNLNMELAMSNSERQTLAQEIENLKLRQETENSKIHKDLEDEIRFQKEANENLSLLLKKTQESNIELISVFQEMEETIEKQRIEIESLSAKANTNEQNIFSFDNELLNLQESNQILQGDITVLESKLEDKIVETEIEQDVKNQILKECVVECNRKLAAKEQKIKDLEAALSRALSDENLENSEHKSHVDIVSKEIGQLNEKVQELVMDCNELTEENIVHLFELKELRKADLELQICLDQNAEIAELQKRLSSKKGSKNGTTPENELFPALLKQLQIFLVRLEKVESDILLPRANRLKDAIVDMDVLKSVDSSTQMERVKAVLDKVVISQKNACQCENSSTDEPNVNPRSSNDEYNNYDIIEPYVESPKNGKETKSQSYHKIMYPENDQTELAKHFSELQEENIYLSQRVSGLEAQLRYLTDTNESSHLELKQSESQAVILRNQITRLEEQIKSQKLDTKHKLLEMQTRWTKAQEECTALSKLNVKLQTTTENLVEEYNSLQKFSGELREQKLELRKRCMFLEAEARKSRDACCNCNEKKFILPKDEYHAQRKVLNSKAKKNYECEDKNELENEAADQEKLVKVVENITNDESKRKSIMDELESKIKLFDLERLRLSEENSVLRMQSEKVLELQNEVLALRVSLKETKFQTRILEASYESVLGDYEELKRENIFLCERNSSMQRALSEVENYKRKENALEEKILRLEGDLVTKDALSVQNAHTKNELNQMKIANSQLVMKLKQLEDVREHLESRVLFLEDELKQSKDDCVCVVSSNHEYLNVEDNQCHVQEQVKVSNKKDYESRVQLLEGELEKTLEANDMYKSQLESASKESECKETINAAKTEHKISVLETELQEIRERYLQISLKYAEVEAQREELVMRLKALNS